MKLQFCLAFMLFYIPTLCYSNIGLVNLQPYTSDPLSQFNAYEALLSIKYLFKTNPYNALQIAGWILEFNDYYDYGTKVYDLCKAAGGSGCISQMMTCTFYKIVTNKTMFGQPPFSYLTELIDIICLREPALKCCLTGTGVDQGCHSAFNTPRPINCEGMPSGGYKLPVRTAGLCLIPADCQYDSVFMCGCSCDHVKDCNINRPNKSAVKDQRPLYLSDRRANFLKDLSSLIGNNIARRQDDAKQKQALNDFLTTRGTKDGWMNNFKSADTNIWPSGRKVEYNDIFTKLYQVSRHQQALAMSRFVNAVPGFWKRFDFINSQLLNETDYQAYMNKNNMNRGKAENILKTYMSPLLMDLFKEAFANEWPLYAIPAANETKKDWHLSNSKRYIDGLELSSPIEATLELIDKNTHVQLNIRIINKPPKWFICTVDWGDMTLTDPVFYDENIIHPYYYGGYQSPGSYLVKVFIVNNDGLRTYIRKTIQVKTGYVKYERTSRILASYTHITLKTTAQGSETMQKGGSDIVIAVEASMNDDAPFMLMDYATLSKVYQDNLKQYSVDLVWKPMLPIQSFRMTCRQIEHSRGRGEIHIDQINMFYFDSYKLANNQTSYSRNPSIVLTSNNLVMKIVKPSNMNATRDSKGSWILPCAGRGDYNDDEIVATFALSPVYIEKTVPLYEYTEVKNEEVYVECSPGNFKIYNRSSNNQQVGTTCT